MRYNIRQKAAIPSDTGFYEREGLLVRQYPLKLAGFFLAFLVLVAAFPLAALAGSPGAVVDDPATPVAELTVDGTALMADGAPTGLTVPGASYDAETATLTLDGYSGGAIVSAAALTLVLVNNDNTLRSDSDCGIRVQNGSLAIQGSGSMQITVTNAAENIPTTGIEATGDVLLESGLLYVTARGTGDVTGIAAVGGAFRFNRLGDAYLSCRATSSNTHAPSIAIMATKGISLTAPAYMAEGTSNPSEVDALSIENDAYQYWTSFPYLIAQGRPALEALELSPQGPLTLEVGGVDFNVYPVPRNAELIEPVWACDKPEVLILAGKGNKATAWVASNGVAIITVTSGNVSASAIVTVDITGCPGVAPIDPPLPPDPPDPPDLETPTPETPTPETPKPGTSTAEAKTTLATLLGASLSRERDTYPTELLAAYDDALTAAQAVYTNPASTPEACEAAAAKLESALNALNNSSPVVLPRLSGVRMAQKSLKLQRGKKLAVPAVAYMSDGSPYKGILYWQSSKPSVASVDENGRITAKKKGKATITATGDDGSTKARLKVEVVGTKVAVKSVRVSKPPKTLSVGKSKTLTASYSPANATGARLTFSSNKPGIVSVDAAGRLTAHKKGTARITIKAGKQKTTIKITVK